MEALGPPPAARPAHRIEFLSGDAMPDAAADRFAAVVARVAHAPTVLILLADRDRLRLVGAYGIPAAWPSYGTTPAGSTMAGLVVSRNAPVIAEDLAADQRVPRGAPALEISVRGYAGYPIHDPDGNVFGVLAVMDSAPRHWTDDELAAVDDAAQACTAFVAERSAREDVDTQRRFLDALLQSLQTGVAACDADGHIVFANEALHRIIGSAPLMRPLAEWSRASYLVDEGGHPLRREQIPLFRALAGVHVRDEELLIRSTDGRIRTVTTDAQPITGAQGDRVGAVSCVRDITDQRTTERFHDVETAVSDALAHAESVQEAGPRILRAVCAGFGWAYAQLWLVDQATGALDLAASLACSGAAPAPPPAAEIAATACRTGQAVRVSEPVTGLAVPARSGDRTLSVLTFFGDTLEPADPLVAFLNGVAAHVAEFLERRRAEELTVALAHSRDGYLALIDHELRTPLTSISAYIDLLRDAEPGAAADELPDILDVLGRNSEILRHIIENLLDLAGLDNGHIPIADEPVDLAATVTAAARAAEPLAAVAGVALDLDVKQGTTVRGDESRLRQVAGHLIANAVGHTLGAGRVVVSLTRPAPAVVELTVADEGLGIPAADQDRVFARFYRSARTREHRLPGVGLGLTISRAIVERHRGTIRFEPCPPPGTRVTVRLPASAP
ncbi:ATP-binding protein [Actinoplanes sp. NPDC020271]|uniref:sensor histidine kinase n=1 Tax=Actinoplanes sp. NPDC020271 TaxID=3363896 RepID=UPI003794CD4C